MLKTFVVGISAASLVALSATGDEGEAGWEHARSRGGVEVSTRPVPGSTYRQFRATGVVPAVAGLVRMPTMLGRWEFTALDAVSTEVVYQQHMDAGGSLPAFVVNRATVDNPIRTLLGLARYARIRRGR